MNFDDKNEKVDGPSSVGNKDDGHQNASIPNSENSKQWQIELFKHVLMRYPYAKSNADCELSEICGSVYWESLGPKWHAGILMGRWVRAQLVPFRDTKRKRGATKIYQRLN